jgi:hypothetical protein
VPISKSLSDTPRGGSGGNKPDENPRFVTAIAKAWHEKYLADGKDSRAMSFDTPFRASDAGFCSMSLGFTLLQRAGMGEPSNPDTLSGQWRMGLGSTIHEMLDEYLPLAFPGAECEVVGQTAEGEASFHADVLITLDDGYKVLLELKSINGAGFKSSTIGFRRDSPAEGPRDSAVMQAALAAEAFDCDEVVVGYLSMENIGDAIAKSNGLDDIGKFAAEWTYTKDEYLPIAQAERARMRWIKATIDAGRMPERTIPGLPEGAVITNPKTGDWAVTDPLTGQMTDIGKTWQCGYCRHQDSCVGLG